MKKLNWKSLLPLAITICAPLIQPQLNKVGVQLAPAALMPTFGMLWLVASPASLGAFVQAFAALLGGLFAHGAFARSTADFTTNLLGIVGAVFVLLGAFGFHFSPAVQEAAGGLASLLIVAFSAHPEHDEFIQS